MQLIVRQGLCRRDIQNLNCISKHAPFKPETEFDIAVGPGHSWAQAGQQGGQAFHIRSDQDFGFAGGEVLHGPTGRTDCGIHEGLQSPRTSRHSDRQALPQARLQLL